MAKDGDIIDAMFTSMLQLVGWIIKMLIKLVFAIIGGLFSLIVSGIKAIFNKNNNAV